MKKRAKVHLLPTEPSSAETCIGVRGNIMAYHLAIHHLALSKFYHIYITTDDEIKEDDTWINLDTNTIHNGNLFELANRAPSCKKIIATTDPKLHNTRLKDCPVNPEDNMVSVRGVSKPSKEFIEEYCRAGGIDEVDVEYGMFHDGNFKDDDDETHAFKATRKPKITSNNEIIIHPIKDSWTREEVLKIIKDFAYCLYEKHGHPDPADTAIWIKENL